jgi:hypothetical protein
MTCVLGASGEAITIDHLRAGLKVLWSYAAEPPWNAPCSQCSCGPTGAAAHAVGPFCLPADAVLVAASSVFKERNPVHLEAGRFRVAETISLEFRFSRILQAILGNWIWEQPLGIRRPLPTLCRSRTGGFSLSLSNRRGGRRKALIIGKLWSIFLLDGKMQTAGAVLSPSLNCERSDGLAMKLKLEGFRSAACSNIYNLIRIPT